MTIHYFGTDLTQAGHYTFLLNGTINPTWDMIRIENWPFPLEEYPIPNMKKGDSHFFKENGKSILYYCGSPKDKRPGCKSVFWVDDPNMDEKTLRIMLTHDAFFREVVKKLIY